LKHDFKLNASLFVFPFSSAEPPKAKKKADPALVKAK
jgi:hypothetical protein